MGNVIISQDAPSKKDLWIQPKGVVRFWNGNIWKVISNASANDMNNVNNVITGYYYNNSFYKDSSYENEIEGKLNVAYIDLGKEKIYRWNETGYTELSVARLEENVTSTVECGGILKGTTIQSGTTFTDFTNKLLNPNPQLTIYWSSVANANSGIPINARQLGKTVLIKGSDTNQELTEYWWKNGTTDSDLIKKFGTASQKNWTNLYDPYGTDLVTGIAIAAALATLPEPMIFMGSIGTNGTISWDYLPEASYLNKGFTYKVITDHNTSPICEAGDTIISDGNSWIVIPSGDEPSGTVTNVAIMNTGGLTITGSPITSSGVISIGHSNVIEAGIAKGSDTSTLTFGGTFTIPSITFDSYGHIVSTTTTTMTMPNNPNVQSDWNQSNNTQDDYIKNKPTKLSDFTDDIVSGNYLPINGNAVSATTASKLGLSNVGNSITPVYLNAGEPVKCSIYRNDYNSSSTWNNYRWYKVAYVITNSNTNFVITLLVSTGSTAQKNGILRCNVRRDADNSGSPVLNINNTKAAWVINNGINIDDFVLVWNSANATAELWYKMPERYSGYHFTVLDAGARSINGTLYWTLCDSNQGDGSATYTQGDIIIKSENNLQLGGRNYLKTNFDIIPINTVSTYSGASATLIDSSTILINGTTTGTTWFFNNSKLFCGKKLEVGKYLIWSNSSNIKVRIGYGDNSTYFSELTVGTKENPTVWEITSAQIYWIIPYAPTGTYFNNETVYLKLEKGTIPTDWTPAPEDILTPSFTESVTRDNIVSKESLPILFGKIKKWFTDLADLAFINKPLNDQTTTFLRGDGMWQVPYETGTKTQLEEGISTAVEVWQPNVLSSYISDMVAQSNHYKGSFDATNGTINETSDTLTSVTNAIGDSYTCSVAGTYATVSFNVGDSLIFKQVVNAGTTPTSNDFTAIHNNISVTANNPTLAWNTESKIGTVSGVDLKVKLPVNPNTNTWRKIIVNGTDALGTSISTGAISFINGTNTFVTFDSTNKTIQVNATNTTYSSGNGISIDNNNVINCNLNSVTNLGTIGITDKLYAVGIDSNGKLCTSVDWQNTTYTLSGLMGSSVKGSTIQPIYWNGNAFVNTTYTLGKSVPSDALFTDTTYDVATQSENGLMSSNDKTKLDELSVGGRNLHKDSTNIGASWTKENATVSDGIATITKATADARVYQTPANAYWTWTTNTQYVASIEAKADVSGKKLAISPYGANVSDKNIELTTEWKRYYYAFKSSSSVTTGSMSYRAYDSNSTIYVRKPKLEIGTIPTDWCPAIEDYADVAFSGNYNDLSNKPTIPSAQIQSDWSQTDNTKKDFIKNKPIIPTKVSDLTNDSGFTNNVGTITGITMNGMSKGTSGVVDLGTILTTHQDISGKADKSATVSNVSYDTANKKIRKTINGTTTDVVTSSDVVMDGGGYKVVPSAKWFVGTAITGTAASTSATISGSSVGDMYWNTSTNNVYLATTSNTWKYVGLYSNIIKTGTYTFDKSGNVSPNNSSSIKTNVGFDLKMTQSEGVLVPPSSEADSLNYLTDLIGIRVEVENKNTGSAGNTLQNLTCIYAKATGQSSYAAKFEGPVNIIGSVTGVTSLFANSVIATSVYQTSDDRLKNYRENFSFDINKIVNIPLKHFEYKDDKTKTKHIGTSAQALEKILPELVNTNEEGFKSVDYSKLSLVAIDCIKQLQNKINELEKRIVELENVSYGKL